MNLFERLKEEIVVSDGAMGTMLQLAGLPVGAAPELWNLEHPEKVRAVHRAYVEAGAQIITTNTFGGNRAKLKEFGLAKEIKRINQRAVEIARSAALGQGILKQVQNDILHCKEVIVAGSIGPTGKFLKPFGELEFDEAYRIFREQAECLLEAGVDVIMIETQIDPLELRAAVLGAKDAIERRKTKDERRIPIIAQFSFNEGVRTVTGTDAQTACAIFDSLQVPVFGANCGSTLRDTFEVIKIMGEEVDSPRYAGCYLIAQPNAGVGKHIFSISEFEEFAVKAVEYGANIVGSCCGSTPEYTKHIRQAVGGMKPIRSRKTKDERRKTKISSRTRTVYIGEGVPFLAVGERINPSGKPKMEEALKHRKIGVLKEEASRQVELGAGALDINIGTHRIMREVIEELQKTVQVPLFIDSQDPEVIEEALKVYGGRGVINSVNAREDVCERILPLAQRYGAAVIGLTIDKSGIPETPSARVKVAKKLIRLAERYGVRDVIIDALVLPVGSSEEGARVTIESVRRIKKELGVPTILGISNISYGLPAREWLNEAFLVAAIQAGLDAAIIDPYDERLMELVRASELLAGRDPRGVRYIKRFGVHREVGAVANATSYRELPLRQGILSGNKDLVREEVNKLLSSGMAPLKIINEFLIPGIEEAGERYERKEFFLPQLIGASEAMREGMSILTPRFKKQKLGKKKILLATVYGDMHDLGKNLLSAILEANGFLVRDLGKDVPVARILKACKSESPDVVGLSSLMTTTLPSLEEAVSAIKREYPKLKIMVGGAVVDSEFAGRIGALYAKDPIETVRLLKTL